MTETSIIFKLPGLATTQQLQSSFCGVDSQSLGGPCNSVDVNQAWENVKQGVTGVQDQASNNRPMILHDGPSLKQELELDFGKQDVVLMHKESRLTLKLG